MKLKVLLVVETVSFESDSKVFTIEALSSANLLDMIYEEKIDLLLHSFVFDVEREGSLLKKVEVMTKSGEIGINAIIFIDCTGDGDLSKFAGANIFMAEIKII